MAQILDGKQHAETMLQAVAARVDQRRVQGLNAPGLAVILVGDDPASQVYVRGKIAACARTGIQSLEFRLGADASQAEVDQLIDRLNTDPTVHGILLQLPVPKHLDTKSLLQRIDPAKDVDGFHPMNQGRLFQGVDGLRPCTPSAVMSMLQAYGIPMKGKTAVVLGRSEIVGKPMALMLLEAHATVTIAHSRTENLPQVCRTADILVAAVGRPGLVEGDWIKPGAVVVDVGINQVSDAALAEKLFQQDPKKLETFRAKGSVLCGDVRYAEAMGVAGAVTPVPGGVGPLTIAGLMENTLRACESLR